MQLKSKMLLVLVSLVLAITLAYYTSFRFVFLESFAELDRMDAERNISRCISAINHEVRLLNRFAHDWSAWDDTYRFIQDNNREFIEANLLWEVFRDQHLNLIHLYDREGRLVWGKAFDLEAENEIPLDLSQDLKPGLFAALTRQHDPDASSSGIILTRYGPMLVSANPILTSEVKGPSMGALVMGRLLNSGVMAQISEQVEVPLTAHPVGNGLDIEPSGAGTVIHSSGKTVIREEGQDLLGVYSLMEDVAGCPALVLKASVPREIMIVGKRVYSYGIILIIGSGIALLVTAGGFLQVLILKPVSRLTAHVLSVGKGAVEIDQCLISRGDELGTLSREFNDAISKLLERERTLWLSEKRLRQIIDHMPHFIYAKDQDGRYILANRIYADALGCPVEEVIGKTDEDFPATRGSAGQYRQIDREVIASGMLKVIPEETFTDGQGAARIFRTTKTPFTFSGTSTPAVLCSSVDITEIRRAQELLLHRGAIIEQSLDGILVTDLRGDVQYANPAWATMHGYTREEIEGRHIDFFHSKSQYENEMLPFIGQVMGLNASRRKIGHMKKDGTEFMTLSSAFILVDQKNVPVAIIDISRDITDEIKMEARVQQMQKMEVVGQLAGGVAHDLNNMLTPILGYAEMTLSHMEEDDPRHEGIYQIMTAADRARALTRQLLAFGRKQVLEIKTVDIRDVVQSYQAIIRRAVREDVEIRIIDSGSCASAKVDIGQIGQIIMNLAVNAQDAMPDGGVLTIETAMVRLDEIYSAAHQGVNPGYYVMLSFNDTGSGMSRETLDHIFEPFFTTKEPGKGTGLGLSTVYGIVDQHGGHISVYSEPKMGSSFRIYLPWADGETEQAAPKLQVGKGRRGKETVIVAEDDDGVRGLACEILEKHGYRVIPAQDPEECIQIIDRLNDTVHLMLTDVIMPGMNGRQLFEAVSQKHPEMKVLFMSGYTGDVIAHHGILEKGEHFIQKPFTIQSLTEKIRDVLDEKLPG